METENKGTENQDLEQAPAAGESVISEDKAVAKFTALRSRAQAAEMRAERAEGVIEGMKQAAVKAAPPAVSPIDAHVAKQVSEGVDEEDVTISPALYRRQKQFELQVSNRETEATATQAQKATQVQAITEAKLVHDDWDDVIATGEPKLSKGELLDIANAGGDYGELAYTKCKAAIERAKPKTEKPAPENKPGEPEEKVVVKKQEPATQDEILAAADGDPGLAAAMNL